ncbi:hypothetical protein ASC84_06420 [Acinetobacter sp. Root1280]|uniref:hypothetical protein n=1 Tax=Acinetobacter sp. Root1280 TaxID=1736444 RepID=UPI0006FA0396|nr:hypothetical protein [Acinetobacter sp. Root1280]KQW98377.1 hypothetical protein ASC84_06420 [Acinetobacter sp. Root1280]
MKNHLQLIFNVIIIIALAGIAYLVWNQSKQSPISSNVPSDINPAQSQVSQPEASQLSTLETNPSITAAELQHSKIANTQSDSQSIPVVESCGANEYSVDCYNDSVPRLYFMYSMNLDKPTLIESISLGKPIGFPDMLINEVKITAKDSHSCEVDTWSLDGETLTDMGLNVSLMPCPEKQVKYVDIKINGKFYRFV